MIKRTLYFGNPVYLSLKNSQMVIRFPKIKEFNIYTEKEANDTRSIPIEDVAYVILDSAQITITHALIEQLMSNNCCLISCDSKHMPMSLMLPLSGNTLQSERYTDQINISLPLKKHLWQQTIKFKILNQCQVLEKYTETETGNMKAWSLDVKSNDSTNLEGRAAAYYWKNLFVDNPKFVRERNGDVINSMLNYGYAILRAVIARAIVGKGLLPTFGIHHHNRYNAYCLADDLMEPYRPYIDMLVLDLISQYGGPDEINTAIKKDLLSIPVIDVKINGKRCPLMIAAEITAGSFLDCLKGETKTIDYPKI